MKSHSSEPEALRVASDIGALVAAALLLILALTAVSSQLQSEVPGRYVDDIVLQEKWRAAHHGWRDVKTLFVGDSSCLMGFSAREIRKELGEPVYNLGTLSTLGLDYFGQMTAAFLTNEGRRVERVVLLLSPEMIASLSRPPIPAAKRPMDPRMAALAAEGERQRAIFERDLHASLRGALGLSAIRTNLVPRVFEEPYDSKFGLQYGFPEGLRRHLRSNCGSAVDPSNPTGYQPAAPRTDSYQISEEIRKHCDAFRRRLPQNVRFFVGITPVHRAGDVQAYEKTHAKMLADLARYLRADAALTNLPPTLPARCFSTETHLNETGSRLFTAVLAASLKR